jgi:hypothetical protein
MSPRIRGFVICREKKKICCPTFLCQRLLSRCVKVYIPEIEFLDIRLTKDSSLLLHVIHNLFYFPSTGGFLRKPNSGFKNTWTGKSKDRNSDKNSNLRILKVVPRNLD